MANVHFILDNEVYGHALRLCNTFFISMTTVDMQMCLNVMLHIHCPSCKAPL